MFRSKLCTVYCVLIQSYNLWLFKGVLKSAYNGCINCVFEPCWEFWFIVLRDLTGQKDVRVVGLWLGIAVPYFAGFYYIYIYIHTHLCIYIYIYKREIKKNLKSAIKIRNIHSIILLYILYSTCNIIQQYISTIQQL